MDAYLGWDDPTLLSWEDDLSSPMYDDLTDDELQAVIMRKAEEEPLPEMLTWDDDFAHADDDFAHADDDSTHAGVVKSKPDIAALARKLLQVTA
jgi:hypothetical protein